MAVPVLMYDSKPGIKKQKDKSELKPKKIHC